MVSLIHPNDLWAVSAGRLLDLKLPAARAQRAVQGDFQDGLGMTSL